MTRPLASVTTSHQEPIDSLLSQRELFSQFEPLVVWWSATSATRYGASALLLTDSLSPACIWTRP